MLGAIDDAYAVNAGQHLQGATHVGVRDRVVVQIEADIGGFWRTHHDAFFARERLGRQPEEPRLFLLEAGAHTAIAIFRARPLGRLAQAPRQRLGVQVGQIGEASGGKEAFAHEADRPLDPTLLTSSQLHVIQSMRNARFGSPIPSTHYAGRLSSSLSTARLGQGRRYYSRC